MGLTNGTMCWDWVKTGGPNVWDMSATADYSGHDHFWCFCKIVNCSEQINVKKRTAFIHTGLHVLRSNLAVWSSSFGSVLTKCCKIWAEIIVITLPFCGRAHFAHRLRFICHVQKQCQPPNEAYVVLFYCKTMCSYIARVIVCRNLFTL